MVAEEDYDEDGNEAGKSYACYANQGLPVVLKVESRWSNGRST